MKRDPALIPLSRDHHQMLLLAQLLKHDAPAYKGLPTTAEGKTKYMEEVWANLVMPHFTQEEALVFPAAQALDVPEITALVDKLREEHRQLRAGYEAVKEAPERVATQDALGRLLEKHIRSEERELFQALQRAMPEEEMSILGKKIGGQAP